MVQRLSFAHTSQLAAAQLRTYQPTASRANESKGSPEKVEVPMKWYSGLPSRVWKRGFSSAFITPLPVKARTAGTAWHMNDGRKRNGLSVSREALAGEGTPCRRNAPHVRPCSCQPQVPQ